ncbi:hypothetical protein JZ751_009211 [Albula glossodonta]|uniref:Uncharacterized protein n=1 Tax=Albula glossodonta TaxID=121402 RepID=A0A8T2N8D8_9TELE|nr:hypothetical protein JZ751_009211 [Albula glossodonta]
MITYGDGEDVYLDAEEGDDDDDDDVKECGSTLDGSGCEALYLYDSQDWVESPACSPEETSAISPMLAEETFRYMSECGVLAADNRVLSPSRAAETDPDRGPDCAGLTLRRRPQCPEKEGEREGGEERNVESGVRARVWGGWLQCPARLRQAEAERGVRTNVIGQREKCVRGERERERERERKNRQSEQAE